MKRGLLAVLLVVMAGSSSGCCCTRNYLGCVRYRVGSCLDNCWYAGWNWCDRSRWDRCRCDRGYSHCGYGDRGYGDCCRGDYNGYCHEHGHACHRRGCGQRYPTDLFVGNGCDPCDGHGHWVGRGRPREPWTASAPPRGQWAADYDYEEPASSYRVNEARVVNSHARGEAPSTMRR
jgi:hypothetical protein